jgi:carbon storage regulator
MLVLSRKESQKIKLGDSIIVTVVRVSGDKVRLGIEAPSDILVLREELEQRDSPQKSGAAPAEKDTEQVVNLAEHDSQALNAGAISA